MKHYNVNSFHGLKLYFLNDSFCVLYFQFSIEDPINSVMYEFDAGVWVKMDAFNDFWRELPVKKLADQLPGIVHLSILTPRGGGGGGRARN